MHEIRDALIVGEPTDSIKIKKGNKKGKKDE